MGDFQGLSPRNNAAATGSGSMHSLPITMDPLTME